jgi:hypothetical protein
MHFFVPEGYSWYKQSDIGGFGTFGVQRPLVISDYFSVKVTLKVAIPYLYLLTAHLLQFSEISWMG